MDDKLVLVFLLSFCFRITTCTTTENCRKTDIIFLLDSSGSISPTDFTHALQFIASFAQALPIGPDKIQIGVTIFSTNAREEIKLNAYNESKSLVNAITHIRYHLGSTHTEEALNYVRGHSFTAGSGRRRKAQGVLIVITDGKSYDRVGTIAAADRIHRDGIITYAIAVGRYINYNELAMIATDLHHQFSTTSYDTLSSIQTELHIAACGGTTTPVISTTTFTTPSTLRVPATSSTTTSTTRVTTTFTWHVDPDDCHDEVSNCGTYGPQMCIQFHEWAMHQCAKFCVFCKLPKSTTTTQPLLQEVSHTPTFKWIIVTDAPQKVNSTPVQFPGK